MKDRFIKILLILVVSFGYSLAQGDDSTKNSIESFLKVEFEPIKLVQSVKSEGVNFSSQLLRNFSIK